MTAAMEFEAKPTRHECSSAKSMVRPKSTVRHASVHRRSDPWAGSCSARGFSRSDTAWSEKVAWCRLPLLLRMPTIWRLSARSECWLTRFRSYTSLQEYPNLCLKMACFHISQDYVGCLLRRRSRAQAPEWLHSTSARVESRSFEPATIGRKS